MVFCWKYTSFFIFRFPCSKAIKEDSLFSVRVAFQSKSLLYYNDYNGNDLVSKSSSFLGDSKLSFYIVSKLVLRFELTKEKST